MLELCKPWFRSSLKKAQGQAVKRLQRICPVHCGRRGQGRCARHIFQPVYSCTWHCSTDPCKYLSLAPRTLADQSAVPSGSESCPERLRPTAPVGRCGQISDSGCQPFRQGWTPAIRQTANIPLTPVVLAARTRAAHTGKPFHFGQPGCRVSLVSCLNLGPTLVSALDLPCIPRILRLHISSHREETSLCAHPNPSIPYEF